MAKVTGLGGLTYKVADPQRTRRWYLEMLGIGGEYGIVFPFADSPGGYSMLTAAGPKATVFDPSAIPFMVNFRVDDLDGFVAQLEAKGVKILGRDDESYGRFAWILDCDGMKVELWQQIGAAAE